MISFPSRPYSKLIGAVLLTASLLPINGQAQENPPSLPHIDMNDSETYRSYDGSGNNLLNPDWGFTDIPLLRLLDADYVDGSTPSGADRPSAREISNAVSLQTGDMPSDKGLNALFWAFGQLLAHDITLVPAASPTDYFNIPVSDDDDYFGMVGFLPLARSAYDPATGTNVGNPRQQINTITAFIDASFVYGSDALTANILRRNEGTGRLITGPDNMLPTNGQVGLDSDPNNDFLFVAVDARVNEQLALSAMHTIFMREHNRLAGLISLDNPGMDGDEIFQMSRMIVGAEMQAITYNEFLPILLGEENGLADYAGYSASVDPGISNEFATAAYRLGHTLLQNDYLIIRPDGPVENLALASCFFNPSCMNSEGLEATIFGLAQQDAQVFDMMFVDAVRNNLITDFGITMLVDLSANNIQRGRDHGLPSYQSTVAQLQAMGLITGNNNLPDKLLNAYGTSEVDLIIGGLAETPFGDALVGEVFHALLLDQFGRLRDGDRFWYQQNSLFDDDMILWLDNLTISDLILWNTDLQFLQTYGFFAVDFGLRRAATHNQVITASYLNALTMADVDAYDLYLIGIHIGASYNIPRALDMIHPEWFNAFTETGLVHARSGMNEITRRIGVVFSGTDIVEARRAGNGTAAGSSGSRQPLAF